MCLTPPVPVRPPTAPRPAPPRPAGSLLVPHEPFELLSRRAIAQLLLPALSCKERVHEELVRIAEQSCPQEASRWGGRAALNPEP